MLTAKSDILKQKVHEMCQLSEYYLHCLMANQHESSYSITKDYTKRLNEISIKYERLIEVNAMEIEQKKRINDEKEEQRQRTDANKTIKSIKKASSKVPQTKTGQAKSAYQIKYDSDDDEQTTDNDTDTYDDDFSGFNGQVIGKSMSNLSKDSGYSEVPNGHMTNSYMSSINDDDVSYTSSMSNELTSTPYTNKSRFMSDMTINEDEPLVNDGFTVCNNKFKFDNDSLMNMSMIENIEIKNNRQNAQQQQQQLNFDMNSSILIFN
jgi:hypothetical protein